MAHPSVSINDQNKLKSTLFKVMWRILYNTYSEKRHVNMELLSQWFTEVDTHIFNNNKKHTHNEEESI